MHTTQREPWSSFSFIFCLVLYGKGEWVCVPWTCVTATVRERDGSVQSYLKGGFFAKRANNSESKTSWFQWKSGEERLWIVAGHNRKQEARVWRSLPSSSSQSKHGNMKECDQQRNQHWSLHRIIPKRKLWHVDFRWTWALSPRDVGGGAYFFS